MENEIDSETPETINQSYDAEQERIENELSEWGHPSRNTTIR